MLCVLEGLLRRIDLVLIQEKELVRHDPVRLAAAIMDIARKAVPAANIRQWPMEIEKFMENFQVFKP